MYRKISRRLLYQIIPDDSPVKTCEIEGYYRDEDDCSIFYSCIEPGAPAIVQNCGPGLYFDTNIYACNWQTGVECD